MIVGDQDRLVTGSQQLADQLKSLSFQVEYKSLPGLDHGGIIGGSMPDVFKFFNQHTKSNCGTRPFSTESAFLHDLMKRSSPGLSALPCSSSRKQASCPGKRLQTRLNSGSPRNRSSWHTSRVPGIAFAASSTQPLKKRWMPGWTR
jgi:hypothetical protein